MWPSALRAFVYGGTRGTKAPASKVTVVVPWVRILLGGALFAVVPPSGTGGCALGDDRRSRCSSLQEPLGPDAPVKGEMAVFAGGCFWGLELAYQRVHGVLDTRVGYTQGHVPNPTYREVCAGTTGHAEAVRIVYDPSIVPYNRLLDLFWSRIDPTQLNRQGNDFGTQYRTGIYVTTEEQMNLAIASRKAVQERLGPKPVVTEIKEAARFWEAEEYHQRYLEKGGQSAAKGETSRIRCYG